MKIKYFYTALALTLICFLTIAAISKDAPGHEGATNKDIIKFSHKVHKEVTDCASCHTLAGESTSLNTRLLPEKSVCATCHDVDDDKNCNLCHYDEKYEPLLMKKAELIFDHKFHTADQKMACESCHKGLGEVDYSFESITAKPAMIVCYDCHNGNSVAANVCESCHISTAGLTPQDHKQVSFFKNHKFSASRENSQCQMCHDNTFCESCHTSTTMITEKNSARDFYTPYSPHKYTDNTKQQAITRVHDLNYQYTHGIELKGKTNECQTCHQPEVFCGKCHDSNSKDFALSGNIPKSHKAPNFVTIGVGTGGGQHAVLARRDIENCSSCHDVQGADQNCILCHVDNDGVKGTNPKTHARNFGRDFDKGDWHSDRGSVCYSCHTDANARPGGIKGVGFCGYCHN
ncbi:MAG: cytochrome C [Ignavibacteriae bacterium HGW-Ignavibacteriae-3]|nr:MAG: cytochrome C [Ignavibacteriae bacterium HGW-Ignavibacteriae-3]